MPKGSFRSHLTGQLANVVQFLMPILTACFHKNAWETVAALVLSCISSGSMGFCTLAEHLSVGPTAFARSRRLERFIHKFKIRLHDVWFTMMLFIVDRHIGESGEIRISIDWTEEQPMKTLSASLLVEGRALVLWAKTYRQGASSKRIQVKIISEAFDAVAEALGGKYDIVILGDREFGNTGCAELAESYGFEYVYRIKGDARGKWGPHSGPVAAWMVAGRRYDAVEYRSDGVLKTSLVAVRSKPTKRRPNAEQWMLMTNRDGTPEDISDLYSYRWGIEAQFRDLKQRLGYNKPRWERADAIDRLWLILACTLEMTVSAGAADKEKRATRNARDWEREQRCVKQRKQRVRLVSFFLRGLAILRTRSWGLDDLSPHAHGRCFLRW